MKEMVKVNYRLSWLLYISASRRLLAENEPLHFPIPQVTIKVLQGN